MRLSKSFPGNGSKNTTVDLRVAQALTKISKEAQRLRKETDTPETGIFVIEHHPYHSGHEGDSWSFDLMALKLLAARGWPVMPDADTRYQKSEVQSGFGWFNVKPANNQDIDLIKLLEDSFGYSRYTKNAKDILKFVKTNGKENDYQPDYRQTRREAMDFVREHVADVEWLAEELARTTSGPEIVSENLVRFSLSGKKSVPQRLFRV